jgi:hypothetical protein
MTIDSLLPDERPPDAIKIDVEGAAGAVLRGAEQTIARHSPAVFLELHGPDEQIAVAEQLLSAGYVAENMKGDRVDNVVDRWVSPIWCFRP